MVVKVHDAFDLTISTQYWAMEMVKKIELWMDNEDNKRQMRALFDQNFETVLAAPREVDLITYSIACNWVAQKLEKLPKPSSELADLFYYSREFSEAIRRMKQLFEALVPDRAEHDVLWRKAGAVMGFKFL
jgi:hypothetical protein